MQVALLQLLLVLPPRRLDLGIEIGQLMCHALERRQRFAERASFADIGPGLVEALPRGTKALQPDQRT